MQRNEELVSTKDKSNEKTILVVEDDERIGPLLVEVFAQETSYKAMWVTDGIRALHVVRQIRPDLLITDYWLPHINGIELYDKLHEIKDMAEMPTIMISAALPEQEVRKRCLVGLSKPFDLDELLDTVERLMK
jgi:DNA-binding response OmpR family regulator